MFRQTEEEESKINFQQICEETSLHGWKFIYRIFRIRTRGVYLKKILKGEGTI